MTTNPEAGMRLAEIAASIEFASGDGISFSETGAVQLASDIRSILAAAPVAPAVSDGERERAVRKVSLWIKCGMPDQSDNTPTRDALMRDLEIVLSAARAQPPGGEVDFVDVEARAEAWSDRVEIKHMVDVTSEVFAKWASPELLSRFRQQMMGVIQQAYIEGAAEAYAHLTEARDGGEALDLHAIAKDASERVHKNGGC